MASLLDKVVYRSEAMQQLRKEVGPFIESATSLLFWGETGSGMGFCAKAIHDASQRPGKLLIIPGFALDDETVKHQFLGVEDRPGWLEEAHKGTIFLKRISEASPVVQQLITQLMGNQSVDGRIYFSRKGSPDTIEANVRFICSVAHDFSMAIQDGLLSREFVDELKKRGRIFHLPPLRKRNEDIAGIVENFFDEFNPQYQQQIHALDDSAQEVLTHYTWPGNVDELKRVIEGIFATYPGISVIRAEHFPEHICEPEITGDKYSFKLKDDAKFHGKFQSPLMIRVQTENKKIAINTGDLIEITRVEDSAFAPPKFKHFSFKLKDGSQVNGNILDKTLCVATSFDPFYKFATQDLCSVVLS